MTPSFFNGVRELDDKHHERDNRAGFPEINLCNSKCYGWYGHHRKSTIVCGCQEDNTELIFSDEIKKNMTQKNNSFFPTHNTNAATANRHGGHPRTLFHQSRMLMNCWII